MNYNCRWDFAEEGDGGVIEDTAVRDLGPRPVRGPNLRDTIVLRGQDLI